MADVEKEKLRDLLEKPLAFEDCVIADLVLSRYRNRAVVRIFVYSKRGATVDECARISRIVGDLIDGTDMFNSGYTLEVSSPGLDRPLTTATDFEFRIGETVAIMFVDQERKKETAEIISANGRQVEFENNDGRFTVALADIEQAKIVY